MEEKNLSVGIKLNKPNSSKNEENKTEHRLDYLDHHFENVLIYNDFQ